MRGFQTLEDKQHKTKKPERSKTRTNGPAFCQAGCWSPSTARGAGLGVLLAGPARPLR